MINRSNVFLRRLIFISICFSFLSASQSDVTAIRLDQPLLIDGRLNESIYSGPSFDYFIQEEPDNGSPVSERTEVWIGYDDAAIYVGYRLWDREPEKISARMTRRDNDFNSDEAQFAIDSYNDNRSGFYFVVNPAGSIQDGTIANDGWLDGTWDGIWDQAARIDDQGWTVEMRIPFSQLRFNTRDEIIMGVGFGRKIDRNNEQALSFLKQRDEPGLVSYFGRLLGINNIKPPKRIEIIPYVTANGASLPSEQDNPFYNGKSSDLGIGTDLKIGIGNNLTVDATIIPDFGQVEVDPSVINLSAYETYYDEKRPFFVEGASIFQFGSGGPTNRSNFNYAEPAFFYSRRIGRPPQREVDSGGWVNRPSATQILGAAKISGKLPGEVSVGGLTALTRREYAKVDEDSADWEVEVEPLTSYNLIRGQKEYRQGLHGIGGLVSVLSRNFDDRDLRLNLNDGALGVGVDGWTFFNESRQWALSWWGGYTRVSGSAERLEDVQRAYNHYYQKPDIDYVSVDPSLTTLEGYAGRLFLNKEKGQVRLNTSLGITSPGFESNDMGINFRTDQINQHIMLGYRWYEPGKYFRSAVFWTAQMTNRNFGGDVINNILFLSGDAQLLNYWSVGFIAGIGPRTLDDTKLRGGPLVAFPAGYWGRFGFHTDSRKNIFFLIDFEGSSSKNGSRDFEIDPEIQFKIGPRFNLLFNPEYYINSTRDQYVMSITDSAATAMYGERHILARLDRKTFEASLRFDYTMTPRLTLQVYAQALLAVGKYSDYKEFARPRSMDYIHYDEAGLEIRYDGPNDEYSVVPTTLPVEHQINDNFNDKSLVGSAVLRWEFRPGSILYVVWTTNSSDDSNPGVFKFQRDFDDLMAAAHDQVLALKLTWWIGR